ncbi:MAG TPA: hypothetical protein GXX34_05995 [Clostridia bacterium]|nr:hypothetical protein [Clostridia bacterium]
MTNKEQPKKWIRQAVALSYHEDRGDTVPKVVAAGKGIIAENIIAKAKEAGVPIHEEPELVQSLVQVELGRPVPPELYEAVAKVLAFILYLDDRVARHR